MTSISSSYSKCNGSVKGYEQINNNFYIYKFYFLYRNQNKVLEMSICITSGLHINLYPLLVVASCTLCRWAGESYYRVAKGMSGENYERAQKWQNMNFCCMTHTFLFSQQSLFEIIYILTPVKGTRQLWSLTTTDNN